MKNTTPSSRLFAYGTLTCGATALLSGNLEAATVIEIDSSTYDTGFSSIGTISSTLNGEKGNINFSGSGVSVTYGDLFLRASDATQVVMEPGTSSQSFSFSNADSPKGSAQLNSSDNWFYAVGAADATQRMWLQLRFGPSGNEGFQIVAALKLDEGEVIDNAAAASAAVPETSSLALLSLGAMGLLKRRRRAA